MKQLVLCIDGAADWPCSGLGGKTPLEAAKMPHLNRFAREGVVGRTTHAPQGMDNGSDVCCMSLLGFDPRQYHTGRAPLEAKSLGLNLAPDEIAVRCNTVTVENETMIDYSAGHISTDESRQLLEAVAKELGSENARFYPGVQYRHILVLKRPEGLDAQCTAPHNITGRPVAGYLPQGKDGALLLDLMERSKPILAAHPVNKARRARGENPASQIWLWGFGRRPSLPTFQATYGMGGALISAVDLLKSLALYLELELLNVPGITGYIDTDYVAKGVWAVEALKRLDFVFVHVEAPDECGHQGNEKEKTESLERIDAEIAARIAECEWAKRGELRILVCPDHATPCQLKAHATEPIPFLAWGPGFAASGIEYGESAARRSGLSIEPGHTLMGRFLRAEM